ncbi:MAG: lanthionine synthetase LanC family protein, partial [Antricoccus sp.]
MVMPDLGLRLVDLEAVVEPGPATIAMFTDGYAPPEQVRAATSSVPIAAEMHLFGLGALLFFVVGGVHPVLAADSPPARSVESRIGHRLDVFERTNPAAGLFAPLIKGLMASEPAHRWSLSQATAFLAVPAAPTRPAASDAVESPDVELLLRDGIAHLLDEMTPGQEHLWAPSPETADCDPCSVQHGAAGELLVLAACLDQPAPVADRARFEETLTVGGQWLATRLERSPKHLPGLHFGHSGAAWALYECGRVLGQLELQKIAIELANLMPVTWPNPDICHGAAGSGTAQLLFWRATGDDRYLDRVEQCADSLLASAETRMGEHLWPVPKSFDSAFRGLAYYGFAHGIAGVATFLLSAGKALGRGDYLDAACGVGQTLAAAAVVRDGAAYWPSEPGAPQLLTHWCSGSSGVGTFLVRLVEETGDTDFLELAKLAAQAVIRSRWHSSTGSCHGLAGDGEFLLDLDKAIGTPAQDSAAWELYETLAARTVRRNGRLLLVDESGLHTTTGYGTGIAGVLAFLLRLTRGGRRLLMPPTASARQV